MTTIGPLTPHVVVRLSDRVFERLVASIAAGELPPGETLGVDALASRLGVSRMPVREALLRLEHLGMIEMSASRFTRVTEMTADDVRDVFAYAGVHTGWAARAAMAAMDDDELAETRETLRLPATPAGDRAPFPPLPAEFTARLARHARSRPIDVVGRDVDALLARALRGRPPLTAAELLLLTGAYQRLHDAMSTRDGDGAERIVREIHQIYAA